MYIAEAQEGPTHHAEAEEQQEQERGGAILSGDKSRHVRGGQHDEREDHRGD